MVDVETVGRLIGRVVGGLFRSALDRPAREPPAAVLDRHLRDIVAIEAEVRRELGRAIVEGKRLAAEEVQCERAAAAAADDARDALRAGREDLARSAIGRQIDADAERASLAERLADNGAVVRHREDRLATVTVHRHEMERDVASFGQKDPIRASPSLPAQDVLTRGVAARAAVARITGGPSHPPHSADAASVRNELADLRREDEIGRRLDALKSERS